MSLKEIKVDSQDLGPKYGVC